MRPATKNQSPIEYEDFRRIKLLRRTEVEQIVGLSRSTLYTMIQEGRFPTPVRVGARAVAWPLIEIEEWIGNLQRTTPTEDDE